MLAHVCTCAVYLVGGGLIIEAHIPVQELEGQREEGAYFREDTVYTLLLVSRVFGASSGSPRIIIAYVRALMRVPWTVGL